MKRSRLLISISSFFFLSFLVILLRHSTPPSLRTSASKFKFNALSGCWKLDINAYITVKSVVEKTPNIKGFVQKEESNMPAVSYPDKESLDDKAKKWGAMASAGIALPGKGSAEVLMVHRMWYSATSCQIPCSPDRSYLYLESYTSHNASVPNTSMGLAQIAQPQLSLCCLVPLFSIE